jgi:transposase
MTGEELEAQFCVERWASSHHWARELQALRHTVRLMPPACVKPYVKRQKNDSADSEGITDTPADINAHVAAIGPAQFL